MTTSSRCSFTAAHDAACRGKGMSCRRGKTAGGLFADQELREAGATNVARRFKPDAPALGAAVCDKGGTPQQGARQRTEDLRLLSWRAVRPRGTRQQVVIKRKIASTTGEWGQSGPTRRLIGLTYQGRRQDPELRLKRCSRSWLAGSLVLAGASE